jgi:hypothetical protein
MLLDFLSSGGGSNHDVGGPFHHFGCFSSSTALMREFGWFYDIFLSQYKLSTNDFSPLTFATLESKGTKTCTSVIAWTG